MEVIYMEVKLSNDSTFIPTLSKTSKILRSITLY